MPIRSRKPVSTAALVWLACCCTAMATTWYVSSVGELYYSLNQASPGDEIVIEPGTYHLTRDVTVFKSNITIRGATGNFEDVILVGGGMNSANYPREGIQIFAPDVTVRDLTLTEFYWHALHFQNGADRAHVINVRTLNIGEQHIKGVRYTNGGIIEHCLLQQTKTRINDGVARPDNYVGGIDLLGASNWTIRDNVAIGIKGIAGGDAGIFLWQEIVNCVVERNVVIGCNKGIAYGNPYNPKNIYHAENSIIRNNFIVRLSGNDIGLELCYLKNVKVYNNTIYSDDPNYFRVVHILDKAAVRNVNLHLAYNIIRGRILDNTVAADYTLTGNIIGFTVQPDWFVDPLNGDLHLTRNAAPAIDGAEPLPEVSEDIDGHPRPLGNAPDVGADEFLHGDLDGDGDVDLADLMIMVNSFGLSEGEPLFDERADIDGNGVVDLSDLLTLANEFGLH